MAKFETIVKNDLAKIGRSIETASVGELYNAVARGVVGQVATKWCRPRKKKCAAYLSAEFLIGRSIYSNLLNARLDERFRKMMADHGVDSDLFEKIGDAALGNGGLGRLAACYLDSAASVGLNMNGYGIRYRYGLFSQRFDNGFQKEMADDWLRFGDPWSTRRESESVEVKFRDGSVTAVPYDMPVIGYDQKTVNTLRLWQAESNEPFSFDLFDRQKYDKAARKRLKAERISDVLYPNDSTDEGKKLRIKQEYFLASATLQDMLQKCDGKPIDRKFAIQLNDTHPVFAIPELIRLLISKGMEFDEALQTARRTFAYTNHTVMPEALETWHEHLINATVPQLMPIIRKLQEALRKELAEKGVTDFEGYDLLENDRIHMARMAMFVCHKVNGVAQLHTDILRADLFKRWDEIYPDRIVNVTNGITQRRWLKLCNPELTELISTRISEDFLKEPEQLTRLRELSEDDEFLSRLNGIKQVKKQQLAEVIARREGKLIRTDALFDVQIKRLHEYKRQFLNALAILDTYYRVKSGQWNDFEPTVYIFGAKAAPGYHRAKAIIKMIHEVGALLERDEEVRDKMQLVFVTDYNVSYAEKIVPAADISEQISLAGTEASGTGNMKLMLNGALTLGTYDGANVEIVAQAGQENNIIFGMRVDEVESRRDSYDPKEIVEKDPRLARALDALINGTLDDNGTGVFRELYDSILNGSNGQKADPYMVCADFADYCRAKEEANRLWRDQKQFAKMRLANIAAAGYFSSDRSVKEYNELIWRL